MPSPVRVLVVAHQSPPLGGPGVRRPASWMREWPRHGVEPALLTAPAEDGERLHGYPIVSGSDDVLAGREVLRVATPEARGFAGLCRRVGLPRRVAWTLRHRTVREPETPWGAPAVSAGRDLGRRLGVRAVVSTSQPYEAHAVGRAVAWSLRVPWIVDFRDPMSEAEGRWWPTRLHWWAERREESRWIREAALVWATCEAAAARLRARFPECETKIVVRRNGVGPIDRDALGRHGTLPPLVVGHLGRFTDRAEGSRLRLFDWRPGKDSGRGSSPLPLFEALTRFLSAVPEARGNVRYETIGNDGDGEVPAGVVHGPHGTLPNAAALSVAASWHALYLPLTTPPPYGSLIVPQKVYEYMALGRPVLVSGTRREASDLLGPLALLGDGDPARLAAHVEDLWSGRRPLESRPLDPPRQVDVARACAEDVLAVVAASERQRESRGSASR
jgi:hypothetical protein